MTSRILIADDHGIVRDGLRDILKRHPGCEVAAIATSGTEALHFARRSDLSLIILDISLPGCSGIHVLQILRAEGITTPVLFFSMHPAEQYAAHVQREGAQGFLGKEAGSAVVIAVVDRIIKGESYFPTLKPSRARRPLADESSAIAALSAREREVLFGMLSGKSLVAIAEEIGITSKSVGTYRRRILDKLGVTSNPELFLLAERLGLAA